MADSVEDKSGTMNPVRRVLGAIFSPISTFKSIADKPTWIFPIILICIVCIGFMGTFSQRVGWRSQLEKQMEANSRAKTQMERMTPEQREQMLDTQVKFAPLAGYAGAILEPPVIMVIVAAIFIAVFNLTSGTKLNFVTSLGIVAHAWVPALIYYLVGILFIFLMDPAAVDLQNLVASNPGAFLSSDSPKWLVSLLRSFDIFTLWIIILLAIGYSVASPKKVSFRQSLASVLFVWLAYVAAKVAIMALVS